MMHHEAGVRVVTVGGRPTSGPMQAASGSRGARYMALDTLDANIMDAYSSSSQQANDFLPNRTAANDVYIVDAGINLRDQVRRGDGDGIDPTPLQFVYEAADCRIYWTPRTVFNYTALWQYAADAAWQNATLCVAGSTGHASSNTTLEDNKQGSDADADAGSSSTSTGSPAASSFDIDTYLSALAADPNATAAAALDSASSLYDVNLGHRKKAAQAAAQQVPCNATAPCRGSHQVCRPIQLCRGQAKQSICVDTCHGGRSSSCGGGSGCEAVVRGTATAVVGLQTKSAGFCVPTPTACLNNGKGKLVV